MISSNLDLPDYNGLRGFTADILLKANSVRWRGIDFTDVSSQMFNHNGLLVISELSGKMGAGNLSCRARWMYATTLPAPRFSRVWKTLRLAPF